ncbi:uncharacterized protein An18g02640 [Aspergillus niger]|uniref:Contig An18c0080, genomic contig n=2 Tax=Aspergillus niger TaxID=5061 RepID=A2RAB8_ASPNC|nr:uncharacterized protein An18g02640 [Aspergillus niger]CAK48647.1 unnamed protein product [Aspergillus niger]
MPGSEYYVRFLTGRSGELLGANLVACWAWDGLSRQTSQWAVTDTDMNMDVDMPSRMGRLGLLYAATAASGVNTVELSAMPVEGNQAQNTLVTWGIGTEWLLGGGAIEY